VRTAHAAICARPLSGFYLAPAWMGRIMVPQVALISVPQAGPGSAPAAWRSSRYAALPEPLVGYRQDALSVRKSWLGRYYFSRAILRVSAREGRLPAGIAAVFTQAAKLALDTAAITTGTAKSLLRHRAMPFANPEAERWRSVWTACAER
jgi:hypothetical protein